MSNDKIDNLREILFNGMECTNDLRIGQLLTKFNEWHQNIYGYDIFYIEDDDFVARLNNYIEILKAYKV